MSTLISDLVDANHILFHQGIVDAFGHVSVRSETDPARFHLARNLAPAQVTAADIVEYRVEDAEPVAADAPRGYLERYIHSEIYRRRPDVMSVVHSHSAAVLPFCIATQARLRPVCHMCGFLGEGPPVFEIREHAGDASDLLIRSRELGAALARTLGDARVVLMRGHGSTVVAESLRVASTAPSTPRSTPSCCCSRWRWAIRPTSRRARPKPRASTSKARRIGRGSCGRSWRRTPRRRVWIDASWRRVCA